jgi:hypothetical protein
MSDFVGYGAALLSDMVSDPLRWRGGLVFKGRIMYLFWPWNETATSRRSVGHLIAQWRGAVYQKNGDISSNAVKVSQI